MAPNYVALRTMQVQNAQGETREVTRGEVVPEVATWPSLRNWVAQGWVCAEHDYQPDAAGAPPVSPRALRDADAAASEAEAEAERPRKRRA